MGCAAPAKPLPLTLDVRCGTYRVLCGESPHFILSDFLTEDHPERSRRRSRRISYGFRMKQLCPQACPKMSFRAKWGTIRVVTQWVIRHRRKRGGVLTRAVRGTGIPSAVRVRFLIEASSGLKRQQYPLRRLRLRRGSPAAADKTLHSSLFTPGCKVNNTLAHRANISRIIRKHFCFRMIHFIV